MLSGWNLSVNGLCQLCSELAELAGELHACNVMAPMHLQSCKAKFALDELLDLQIADGPGVDPGAEDETGLRLGKCLSGAVGAF